MAGEVKVEHPDTVKVYCANVQHGMTFARGQCPCCSRDVQEGAGICASYLAPGESARIAEAVVRERLAEMLDSDGEVELFDRRREAHWFKSDDLLAALFPAALSRPGGQND